jgi:hypothetical protein
MQLYLCACRPWGCSTERSNKISIYRNDNNELLTIRTESDHRWKSSQLIWYYLPMTEASSYAMPTIDSMWEWQPGNPMAREVVKITEVDPVHNLVWLDGSSGNRVVNLADFAAQAVPATLRRHR